jgi:hypothetical protein
MISEVGIRDWIKKCDKAENSLSYHEETPWVLVNFIDEVREYFESQQKQVAALFKPPVG